MPQSRLRYDPISGEITWKTKRRFGRHAGSLNSEGYREVQIDKKYWRAHRLAWFLFHGEMPEGEIDHINGDRSDNRIANLRVATRSQNSMNAKRSKNSSTGLKGVTFHKKLGKWQASICAKYLGVFETPEAAHAAYCSAAQQLHGEFARFE